MSQQAWEVVRNARSNMIKIINSEVEKLPPDSSGMALSKRLFEKIMELEQEPTRAAIDFVKAEIARMILKSGCWLLGTGCWLLGY